MSGLLRALWFIRTSLGAGATWQTEDDGPFEIFSVSDSNDSRLSSLCTCLQGLFEGTGFLLQGILFLSVETISSNHWGLLFPSSLWSLHVFFSFHHWLLMVPSSTRGLPDNPNCLPSLPVKTEIAFKRLSDAIIWTRQKVSTGHFILCFLAAGIWCGTWQKARASLVSSFKNRACVC